MANQIVITSGAKVRGLNGVLTGTSGIVSSVPLGAANGVATLDSGGKVPVSQLPSSVVTYLGTWNAATNTPTLVNGTGDAGDMYICNVAGTVNFGAGPVTFAVGDWVLYGSGTWQKSSGQNGTVTSVAVTETGDSLNITGSPITTSGTINIGFNGTNLQYVNGAGNLTTFPILTGYVTAVSGTAPVVSSGGTTPAISMAAATGSVDGYLLATDFAIFNAKQSALTFSSPLVNTSGTISIPAATTSVNGYLASADFTTFNAKQNAITLTTTGTSGASTLVGATLNIPDYGSALTGYVTLATTQTITGAKTFSGYTTFTSTVDITSGLTFSNSGFTLLLQPPTLSVNRTVTLPNGTGTLALTSDISYPVTSVFGRTGAVVATNGDYTTAQVTEVTNLYFTDSRARLALSGSTGISYNNTTGVITNSAPDQVVALTASTGISVTGTYPNFTITNTSPSSGGTVTSVAALTIGTSGTDLSSSVANSTTTPVITLNVPTASATNRGALSSADWTTFNNKQGTITLTTTGTSGAATFSANTLNIPNYGSALSGYLPLTGGTLTGALSGTSASFSSTVIAGGTIRTTGGVFQLFNSSTFLGGLYPYATWLGSGSDYAPTLASATDLYFATGDVSAKKMTLTAAGRLLLGTTTESTYLLDVNGTGRFSSSVEASGGFISNNDSNTPAGFYKLKPSSVATARWWRITSDNIVYGDFCIAQSSANSDASYTNKLYFNATGAATFSSNLTLSASNGTLDVGGEGFIRGNGSAYKTHEFTTGASNVALYDQKNAAGTSINRLNAGGTSYINGGDVLIANKVSITDTASFGGQAKLFSRITADATTVGKITDSSFHIWNTTNVGSLSQITFGYTNGSTTNASVYLGLITTNGVGSGYGDFVLGTAPSANVQCVERLRIASTGAATFSDNLIVRGNSANTIGAIRIQGATSDYQGISLYTALSGSNANSRSWQIAPNYTANGNFEILVSSSNTTDPTNSKLTITSGGNVLIGDTTDSGSPYKLQTKGSILVKGNINDNYSFYNGVYASSTSTIYSQFTGNWQSSNNWGIGSKGASDNTVYIGNVSSGIINPSGTFTLTICGSAYATSFFESSDSRLKTLIQDNYQTKGIASITPKLYTKNGKVELGYYAQDFVGILDSAVSKGSDDMLSLSYREVLVAKVYALEQEIKELKAKMN